MSPHHGHQTAPTSRRIGRSNSLARLKASVPQGYQPTGCPAARARYTELCPLRWLGAAACAVSIPASVVAISRANIPTLFFIPDETHGREIGFTTQGHPPRNYLLQLAS